MRFGDSVFRVWFFAVLTALPLSVMAESVGRMPDASPDEAMQRWGTPDESRYQPKDEESGAVRASAVFGYESPNYPAETGGRDHNPTASHFDVGQIAGEQIDPRTLTVSWTSEDIRLPGNAGHDLVLTRTHGVYPNSIPMEVGNWHLDVPRITIPTSPYQEGLWNYADSPWYIAEVLGYFNSDGSYTPNKQWSGVCNRAHKLALHQDFFKNPQAGPSGTVSGYLFAGPMTMYIPGEGAKVLLNPTAQAVAEYPSGTDFVTTDNWYIKCTTPKPAPDYTYLPLPGYMGGFTAYAPDGRRFIFDWMQWYQPGETNYGAWGGQVHLVARRIEDVNGNAIHLDYDLNTGLLTRMSGYDPADNFDGRRIDLFYDEDYSYGLSFPDNWSGAHLERAVIVDTNNDDGGDTVINYRYCGRFSSDYPVCAQHNDETAPQILHEVELPDGLRWQYEARQFVGSGRPTANLALTKVVLPTNGSIEYEYLAEIDNASNFSLQKRKVRGLDIPESDWSYSYVLNNHIETTTITGPDRRDIYEFYEGVNTLRYQYAHRDGNYAIPPEYSTVAGRLKKHSVKSLTNTLLRATNYEYGIPPALGRDNYANHSYANREIVPLAYTHKTLVTDRTVTDYTAGGEGRQYKTRVALDKHDFFGMPLVIDETGDNGAVEGDDFLWKRATQSWRHTETPWRVGLLTSDAVWDKSIAYDYNAKGQRTRVNRYGVITDFEYYADGNLHKQKWLRDGTVHVISYGDYHRGKPQSESHPVDVDKDVYSNLSRSVDDFGRIRWERDGEGNQTAFAYDGAGRLTSVVPAAHAATNIQYRASGTGRWYETRTLRGGYQKRDGLDVLGRSILLQEFDGQNPNYFPLSVVTAYDAVGRIAERFGPFEYASTSSVDSAPRTSLQYDALGRTTRITNPDATTVSYCYEQACNTGAYALYDSTLENGFIVTDERGYQTGYEYLAYGDPDDKQLARIVQQATTQNAPVGVTFVVTEIGRTALGDIAYVRQGDGDSEDRLTRNYSYNAANQLAVVSHPETGDTVYVYDEAGNRTSERTGASGLTRYHYDGRNRVVRVDYPGLAPDVALDYFHTDRLKSIDNSIARWDYSYTAVNQISRETLSVGENVYELTHFYNALGNETALRYPNGEIVSYAPDDFGRPRELGDYLSTANYWPSGNLRSLGFGNGVTTQVSETQRQISDRILVTGEAGSIADLDYRYDAASNVTAITDSVVANNNRSLSYDGLSRLTRANGFWGSGRIDYDALGNIKRKQLGNETLDYQYDLPRNQLQGIQGGAAVANYSYDVRGNVRSDGIRTFNYNSASQLLGSPGAPNLELAYDGHNRRTVETRDGKARITGYSLTGQLMFDDRCIDENVRTNYYYLQTRLIAKRDGSCEEGCHPR